MKTLIVIFLMLIAFALLTLYEVFALRKRGIDIFGHLSATWQAGDGTKFAFQAFGVIAFLLGQPILLTVVLVWAFGEIEPLLEAASSLMATIIPFI